MLQYGASLGLFIGECACGSHLGNDLSLDCLLYPSLIQYVRHQLPPKIAPPFVQVTKAKVEVLQKPWQRVTQGGMPHEHGYSVTGTEVCIVVYEA
jgi:hypothetical protein